MIAQLQASTLDASSAGEASSLEILNVRERKIPSYFFFRYRDARLAIWCPQLADGTRVPVINSRTRLRSFELAALWRNSYGRDAQVLRVPSLYLHAAAKIIANDKGICSGHR